MIVDDAHPAASLVLSSFNQIFQLDIKDINKLGVETLIPHFLEITLLDLANEAISVFQSLPSSALVEVTGNIVVVGDIHGNLTDLVRILLVNGLPPQTKYLFLGDYVDRGSFSTECLALITSLFVLHPQFIFWIRGNHEISEVNRNYGFYEEIFTLYNSDTAWREFNRMFAYLPLAAVINNKFFCVHGGICKGLTMNMIKDAQLPLNRLSAMFTDILWSDPNEAIEGYNQNLRGKGCEYGVYATLSFLDSNDLNCIIRGHQCVKEGIKVLHLMNVVTVFSSSCYTNDPKNKNYCGYLVIDFDNLNKKTLPIIKLIDRTNASTFTVQPQGLGENGEKLPELVRCKSKSMLPLNQQGGFLTSSRSSTNFRKPGSRANPFSKGKNPLATSVDHKMNQLRIAATHTKVLPILHHTVHVD